MREPPWSGVVFDVDGTVANTIPLIIASYRHAMRAILGIDVEPDEARSWIGQTLVDTFGRRYPDHAEALVDSYVAYNLARLETDILPYAGIREVLDALGRAGVVTGVATSKRRISAQRTLRAVGIADLVELTVAMEDTDVHKPHPEPLLLATQRLGLDPGRTVYVGDAVVDVQAAAAAGLDSIAVTWGAGLREDLEAAAPTAIVDTSEQLRALLLG